MRDDSLHHDVAADLTDVGVLRLTARPESKVLQSFFAGYDQAFVLPDEREEFAGFQACLAQNARWSEYGGRSHREFVATLEGPSGEVLAGANWLAIAHPPSEGPPLSLAVNYLFVTPTERSRGHARTLLDAIVRATEREMDVHVSGQPAIFIEQNDPVRMSAHSYAEDSRHAGLDQVDRLAVAARLGARLVDFDYVQPALSAQHAADDTLLLAALQYPGSAVPKRYLRAHLESFFVVSVRKGRPLADDPISMRQLNELDVPGTAKLLSLSPGIDALRQDGAPRCATFRALTRMLHGDEP